MRVPCMLVISCYSCCARVIIYNKSVSMRVMNMALALSE